MLNCDFSKKMGKLEYDGKVADIVWGNCLVVILYRKTKEAPTNWDEYWTPPLFFNDEVHMKRCLGLAKGYDDIFEGLDLKLTLFRNKWDKAEFRKVLNAFAQRKGNTTIEIREEE